jgi:ATP-dependent helicase/nuclease subunit B
MERQGKQALSAGTLSLLIPFSQDPLAVAAARILDHYQRSLPDLTHCRVLVADNQCAAQLRAELLRQAEARGITALLGPTIERLETWLAQFPAGQARVLGRPAQELVLAEALREARHLYADTDPWLLADQLLTLFDELTHHHIPIPDQLDDFTAQLERSYGVKTPSPALQQEAYILHTLWHAWRQQLAADQSTDTASAYVARLDASLERVSGDDLWLLGFDRLSPAEARWLRTLLERQQVHLLLYGSARHADNHPDEPLHRLVAQLSLASLTGSADDDTPFSRCIQALFEPSGDNLRQRAQRFAEVCPDDPLRGRVHCFCADDPEEEARAVALQVKRWLLDGIAPIAVVTADRRLARRVRALMEVSGIVLDDPGGWALSTSSAAATLERWLETVEEDFACGPLLDVLKSPLVTASHTCPWYVGWNRTSSCTKTSPVACSATGGTSICAANACRTGRRTPPAPCIPCSTVLTMLPVRYSRYSLASTAHAITSPRCNKALRSLASAKRWPRTPQACRCSNCWSSCNRPPRPRLPCWTGRHSAAGWGGTWSGRPSQYPCLPVRCAC